MRTERPSDQPGGRLIVIDRSRVRRVEEPAVGSLDGHAAMSARMTEQRDEIHLRFEWQTDGIEVVPFRVNPLVKDEFGLVCNVSRDVGIFVPVEDLSIRERVVFVLVHVDFGLRKIGKPATMVEMHVGEDDVLYVPRLVSQCSQAAYCRFGRIEGHDREDAKQPCDRGRLGIILQAQAGVHENETMIRFDQQAECSGFHFAGPAGVAREAVEKTDGHTGSVDNMIG